MCLTSVVFDGDDDYIDIPDIPLYGNLFNGEFTFSAYVYAKDQTSTDFFNILSTDDNSPGNLLQWGCYDDNLSFSLHTSSGVYYSNSSINRYEWTYVTVTYDGSYIKFYTNGVLNNVEPASININAPLTGFNVYR